MAYDYITKCSSPTFTPAAQVPNVYGQARKVKSITIHHWGNRGQRFQDVVNFLCSSAPTSAHYVVEAGKVACIVDPENAAWHCGNATGNATSIGIECRPEATDGDYATTAELIRELRAVYGDIPLVPHKDWFNTACPGVWDLKRLDKLARQGATTVKPAASTSKPAPEKDWFDMATSKDLDAAIDRGIKRHKLSNGGWSYKNTKVEKSDAYAILRDARDDARKAVRDGAARDAQISNLVSAVAALAKGEPFDEAKLLAGVKAAAEAGVKNAVDSIETTTTVNIK